MDQFRRHRAWCPHGRPPGRRRLDLATDHGAFPVWEWAALPATGGRPPRHVHGNVAPASLRLSADLADALRSWADWPVRHAPAADQGARQRPRTPDGAWHRWSDEGAALARRLADETGAEVVFQPELVDDCRHCQGAGR